jgi:sphingolipid delta-4 desaturase
MNTQDALASARNIALRFSPRILGMPAPVFPGYEVDICDSVPDRDKQEAVWHRDRAKGIVQAHPQVKELFGNTPSTAFWCLLTAGSHLALAMALSGQSLWVLVVAAYVFGAWLNLVLFNLAHECNHNLVFKKTAPNRWLFLLTTLPMFLPGHHTWWMEHHVHHNDMGAKKDFITRRRSFFLVTRNRMLFLTRARSRHFSWIGWIASPLFMPYAVVMLALQVLRSLLGLVFYALSLLTLRTTPGKWTLSLLADVHLVSGYERSRTERWAVFYPLCVLGAMAALGFFFGWQSILYLFLSQLFMTGFLHPLAFGMILNNSHFHSHDVDQPSSSYYGWLNWISFNFGLHTEHHDISGIPWSRLPKLRRMAPEFYDDLVKTRSYVLLAMRFVFGGDANFVRDDLKNGKILLGEHAGDVRGVLGRVGERAFCEGLSSETAETQCE